MTSQHITPHASLLITQTFSFIRKLLFMISVPTTPHASLPTQQHVVHDRQAYQTTCSNAHPAKLRSWPTSVLNHVLLCLPSRNPSWSTSIPKQMLLWAPSIANCRLARPACQTTCLHAAPARIHPWSTNMPKHMFPCPTNAPNRAFCLPSIPNSLLLCLPFKGSFMLKEQKVHLTL